MSPYDANHAARALAAVGVFALVMACDALANTEKLRPDETTKPATGQASLLAPEAVSAAEQAFSDSLGAKTRALELRAFPDRWVLQAEDPERPGRLIQLEYLNGRMGPPLEMTLRGSGDLEQNLFLLSDVALDTIPDLVEKARLAVDPEDGNVDYVLVRRALPFAKDVRLRVFVKSPRRDGYLDADPLGRPIE